MDPIRWYEKLPVSVKTFLNDGGHWPPNERLWSSIYEMEQELANRHQCSTCCGTPHASGLPCICGGTNSSEEELRGLRLAAIKGVPEQMMGNGFFPSEHNLKLRKIIEECIAFLKPLVTVADHRRADLLKLLKKLEAAR